MELDTVPTVPDPPSDGVQTKLKWAARRPCKDCGSLALAKASPILPDLLEYSACPSDETLLQGPRLQTQLFVCHSCGRGWLFDGETSAWSWQH